MFIKDNDVARDVFEFAAQTTANPTSNAEFGLDMIDFSDGFSMNTVQTGEISAKGLANVTPLGQIGNIDLGGNHFIQDANWIENNHSHPGFSRYGQEELGQPIEIDDLTYVYTGNQLQSVTDATNNAEGFNDGNTAGNDYVYDSFGNITQDKNKKITNAKYNHQNLPTEVVFNTGKINYTYDAAGTRLKKQVVPTSAATQTTDYINGFQYVDNVLKFFPHPEGYVEFKNNQYLYTYQYKDHLGNVRLTYRDGYRNHPTLEYAKDGVIQVTEIIEENNYYPFGLKHKGYNDLADYSATNKYKYRYNGFEYQEELGLNWYNYGVRNYDPALGRWFNVDPASEMSRRFSPYVYTLNNPIYFRDPDGMVPTSFGTDDIYLDARTGEVLGRDGAATNEIRVIYRYDWEDAVEKYGGTNGSLATTELQNKSSIVTVDNTKINFDVGEVNNQTITDQSNGILKERSVVIGFNVDGNGDVPKAQLTSQIGPVGKYNSVTTPNMIKHKRLMGK